MHILHCEGPLGKLTITLIVFLPWWLQSFGSCAEQLPHYNSQNTLYFFFLMNTGGSLIGRGVVGEVTLSSMLHPSFSFPMDLTFSIGMFWSTIYFLQHWQNSRALLKDIILNPLCLMGGSRVKQCHCLLPVSIRPCIFLCWLKLHSSKCLGVFYDAS